MGQRLAPRSVSPTVRQLFFEMFMQGMTIQAMADHLGLQRPTVAYWKSGRSMPRLDDIENAFAVLGYEIKLVKTEEKKND